MKPVVRKIAKEIRKRRKFLISGHVRGDGDAMGSQLALMHALRRMKKKASVVSDAGVIPEIAFLPGAGSVGSGPEDLRPPYDALIVLDSGTWERLERIASALDRDSLFVINIDHHSSNERFGDLNWVDADYSCCGEMVLDLLRELKVKPDRKIAACIYVAMVTDTGKFSFSNTTPQTHRNAAELLAHGVKPHVVNHQLFRQKTPLQLRFLSAVLDRVKVSEDGQVAWVSISRQLIAEAGFEPGDTQEYVDTVRSLRGVKVALLFREMGEGIVKVSFRTHEGVDGIKLASKWGGGGHVRASGASVRGSLEEVEREVTDETIRFARGAK